VTRLARLMVLAAMLAPLGLTPALAQGGNVRQSGNVTPQHWSMWTTDGVIQDAGSSANPFVTSGGILSPMSQSFCIDSGLQNAPYIAFCEGMNPGTGATFSITPFGGATNRPFLFQGGTGIVSGNATGGAEGVGTLNATGLYINGVPVGTGGTITGVTAGAGLNGGGTSGVVTLNVTNTAVTPGTYGDAFTVPQITVNSRGQLTAVTPVTILGAAPTGPAGGDLTGNYPNPLAIKTQGVPFGTAATDNTGTSGATIPLLNGTNVWSGQQSGTPTTLTISTATFTPNGSSNNYSMTLVHASCPCTLANPSATPVAGTGGQIVIKQSSSGSDTIGTWGSDYVASGGTSTITLSTGANAIDILAYYVIDSTHIALSLLPNFSH
jgi:hypothetical protein